MGGNEDPRSEPLNENMFILVFRMLDCVYKFIMSFFYCPLGNKKMT